LLAISLAEDEHHFETPVGFFTREDVVTKVYEDEQGIICYARATKSLRLDIHFLDNGDEKRNAAALIQGSKLLFEMAKANGFSEVVFTTNVPKLAGFCEAVFGYEKVSDQFVLRKLL
jgi:hypothetical protein